MSIRNLYKMATLESMETALREHMNQAVESKEAMARDILNCGYNGATRMGNADKAMEREALGSVAKLILGTCPDILAGRNPDGEIGAAHIWEIIERDAMNAAARMSISRPEEVAEAKAWVTIAQDCRNARRYVEQYGLQDANHRIHGSHARWTAVMERRAEDNEWGVAGGCECNFTAMLDPYPCAYCNEVEAAQRSRGAAAALKSHAKKCREPKAG